jgi:hypothetical protein
MAGNRHRQRIGADGPGNGANRARRSDSPRELPIAHGLAGRDIAQCPPHPLLKRRAPHVEGQVEADARRLDATNDPGDQSLESGVAADQAGARKAVLEIAREHVGIVPHEDGADTAPAVRDQDRAERAFADGEADLGIGAAGAKSRGGHAQNPIGLLVEASVGAVAGPVDGVGHRRASAELAPDPGGAMGRRIGPRRQPGDRLEDAMEVIRAHPRPGRQLTERRRALRRLDDPASSPHCRAHRA